MMIDQVAVARRLAPSLSIVSATIFQQRLYYRAFPVAACLPAGLYTPPVSYHATPRLMFNAPPLPAHYGA